MTHARWSG